MNSRGTTFPEGREESGLGQGGLERGATDTLAGGCSEAHSQLGAFGLVESPFLFWDWGLRGVYG